MNSNRATKLNPERPGSSARVYDYDNSNYESVERRSKIPKLPNRTYSLECKSSCFTIKKGNARKKINKTSMIPRPEWTRPGYRKIISPNNEGNMDNTLAQPLIKSLEQSPVTDPSTETSHILPSKSLSVMENKLNKELVTFKNNVLRIPEYWTDAGESVTSILKNAINIITKQYPTADVESFEKDIENILKATESVKQQILSRTESIITKATEIYVDKNEKNMGAPDDLKHITKKISDLKNEVNYRKNVFGDLLKYGSEMKELLEIEKTLKQKSTSKDRQLKNFSIGPEKSDIELDRLNKHYDGRKYKFGTDNYVSISKKPDKHTLQSCGDIARQVTKIMLEKDPKAESVSRTTVEEKASQTVNSWYDELLTKEKDLKELNKQITELHQLCKEHISKFKNFNLQIKMRGICNKVQHISSTKEFHIQNDGRTDLEKSNLAGYSKELESAMRQKDLDFYHKEKLINQQKKLLHVRDELIGMLKNRCHLEEQSRY